MKRVVPIFVVFVIGSLSNGCYTKRSSERNDAGSDNSGRDEATVCTSNIECSDGLFCNGDEICYPGASGADERGCVKASRGPCDASALCLEKENTCIDCAGNADFDGDGHDKAACGGDDCNDSDPNSYPGNQEVCDLDGHDEDCDPTTFGEKDSDGDGEIDSRCRNAIVDVEAKYGTDCDDNRLDVGSMRVEICDGIDNDCDGEIDEEQNAVNWYEDKDGDGFGTTTVVRRSCQTVSGTSLLNTDCDDQNAAIHPGSKESCDEIDNDCDAETDEVLSCRFCGEPGRKQACACEDWTLGVSVCGSDGQWGLCDCGNGPSCGAIGESEGCRCEGGPLGARTCRADGDWSPCECNATTGGTGGTSGSGAGGTGGGGEVGGSGGSGSGGTGGGNEVGGSGGNGDSGSGGTGGETLVADCDMYSHDIPCSGVLSVDGDTVVELGPYGSIMEWNVGAEFTTQINPLESGCTAAITTFDEDTTVTAKMTDLKDLDLTLNTVFRPVDMKQGEKFPVIAWGNGTCLATHVYSALLHYVASHGFFVFAANNRFVASGAVLTALDYAFAANENPNSPYYQRLDTTRVGVMGHSQGGVGAINAAVDDRVKAMIVFNSGSSASKPFIAVSGDYDIGSTTGPRMASDVAGAPVPAAWIFYHKVAQTGTLSGHLLLILEPERVVEFTTAWWQYMLNGDATAREMFVGEDCGLCNRDEEFEYGQKDLP